MYRKDARGAERAGSWKTRVTVLLGLVTVVAVCVLIRQFRGPDAVQAQAPVRTPDEAGSSPPAAATPRLPAAGVVTPATRTRPDPLTLTVMATVNGENITRQQLAQECLRRYGQDVLESIVNKHLIWAACQERGVRITDQDVENEIARIAAKFGLSRDRWLIMLQEERDISAPQYRREIIWPTLALRALAAHQIEITQQELQEAYQSEYGPRVKVRIITSRSRDTADQLRLQALANPDAFDELAKDHSEDQSAAVRGLVPPIRMHSGSPELERVAFSLQVGEISEVVAVGNQFVIMKCEEQVPATYIADRFRADAEARLTDRIRDQKLRAAATEIFQQLQQHARVVNVLSDPAQQQRMPGVAATINDESITMRQLAEECLVRYGSEVLEGEINRLVLLQALRQAGQTVEEADLDTEIARAAASYGFVLADGRPDVDKWLDEVTEGDGTSMEIYVRDAVWPTAALKKIVNAQVHVTEEDLQQSFEANFGERVEVMAIVLGNQRQALSVWQMAKGNPTDAFFGELAHQYSVDPISRENFGRVPPIRRYGGQPKLEEEAFAMQPGDLSGVISSGESFVILRCIGRTEPVVEAMDDEIRAELIQEIHERKMRIAMAEEFDQLRSSAQIDNFLAGTSQSGREATALIPAGPSRF